MIRGIRGATTVEANQPDEILNETAKLVLEIAKENTLQPEDIVSVLISTTPDINTAFPAKAVRTLEGWQYVPTMCMHEMNVPGALPLCIRVLMHVNSDVNQKDVQHVYLNGAVVLRPDLVK
ncbi:chorismate mutase [Ureibacillus massiliensis 4400831 = CIP 108448 = CCUG 49529]|uniref:chorismate mutase n=1 Tax=Ureibacillus massiliensis 4400831 = CIP 108448 = CCUG 49529 TaxID=1211035 RepID=A0A0A3IUT8_9BACL|nr:chorismate mutase [Ureibacillus massiliensis]KGR88534.1 chorismate mutase [Ureibacillus massiliensis 4400831 = CIP 108448 = CCUG 49529]